MTQNEPIAQAMKALSAIDPNWQALVNQVGPCLHPLIEPHDPFKSLVKAVAYQQLHARAGDAMLRRLRELFPGQVFPTPAQLVALEQPALASCGFSTAKCKAIKAIALARLEERVPDVHQALAMSEDALIQTLVALPGVGQWTVEMMLIYGLGKRDVFPASDFGVREGFRRLYGLAERPGATQLKRWGHALAPYRTLGAWYLWRVPVGFEPPEFQEYESKTRSGSAH